MCDFPRCKHYERYGYMRHALCQKHWDMLCEAGDVSRSEENKLLRKLGLERTKEGEVVEKEATGT
jgi:hypothetical protein